VSTAAECVGATQTRCDAGHTGPAQTRSDGPWSVGRPGVERKGFVTTDRHAGVDEIEQTLAAYETASDAFREKYLGAAGVDDHHAAFVDALDGERVLDVGCGPGRDVASFAADGYEVVGLDVSQSFLRTASDQSPESGFARGDMRTIPVAGRSFDGLWSCASLLHVPREDAVPTLREFRRVLVPGGVAFLSLKRRPFDSDGAHGRHFEYYDPDGVRTLLGEADLQPVTVAADDRWVAALARRP
jgi:SAM-dependent methyltransferase